LARQAPKPQRRVFSNLRQLVLRNEYLRKEFEEFNQETEPRFQIVFETLSWKKRFINSIFASFSEFACPFIRQNRVSAKPKACRARKGAIPQRRF
jgi:hypothetical protein